MQSAQLRVSLLEQVALAWNQLRLDYAVAHGLEEYLTTMGRDLDVLIRADQIRSALASAEEVLHAHGWTVVRPPSIWGQRLVAIAPTPVIEMVEIHTVHRITWRGVMLIGAPTPSGRRGPFQIDPWASFVKSFFAPLLAGNHKKVAKAIDSLGEAELLAAATGLPPCLGTRLTQSLLDALSQADQATLKSLSPVVRRTVLRRGFARHPARAAALVTRSLGRKAAQPFVPCAPIIAIVGPDGVGKSTLTDTLARGNRLIFTDIITRHWRPGILPRIAKLLAPSRNIAAEDHTPRRQPGSFYWLRLGYYFMDYFIGGLLRDRVDSSRQRLVIYDRCFLDMFVDPARFGLSSTRGLSLCWRLLPKPDLIILLRDRPESIHDRKPELPVSEIRHQYQKWDRWIGSGEIQLVLDVNAAPEQLADQVLNRIGTTYLTMAKRRGWKVMSAADREKAVARPTEIIQG